MTDRKQRISDHRLTGWARFVERLYRLTHGGRIRTLVITDERVRGGNDDDGQ
jgi:hypothetical protein